MKAYGCQYVAKCCNILFEMRMVICQLHIWIILRHIIIVSEKKTTAERIIQFMNEHEWEKKERLTNGA